MPKEPNFIVVRMERYEIPDAVWSACNYSYNYYELHSREIEYFFPCLSNTLSLDNYADRWHYLLYMEEAHESIMMRANDIPTAVLRSHYQYHCLDMINLNRRKPYIMKGDKVIVKYKLNDEGPPVEGIVSAIRRNEL